jgi:fused signal recognition particle receptor
MAGFFKKLFNRIAGKPAEEATLIDEVQVLLPAREPEPVVLQKAEKSKVTPKVKIKVIAPKLKKAPAKTIALAKPKAKPNSSKAVAPAKAVTPPPPVVPAGKRDSQSAKSNDPLSKVAKSKQITAKKIGLAPQPGTPPPPPIISTRVDIPRAIEAVLPKQDSSTLKNTDGSKSGTNQPSGWFSRLKDGLSKSSKTITGSITAIFTKRKLDRETLQELEDTLIQADLGITVSERIIAAVSHGRYDKEIDPEDVKRILSEEVAKVLKPVEVPFNFGSEKPFVILVVGVNGAGKTTTIGKLGSIAAAEGFKVMFAACDTFRAAAVEQLTVWGKRIGAVTKSATIGADAAGLAFDSLKQAREEGADILFIDTAGRLQNKAYLMDELDKVVRVIKKMDAAAPHAVLLVLDATTGQNALAQAEIFTKVAGVTGIIMTKLDGTARGGILVAIAEKFKLPIHAIGVGESIDDLQPFDAEGFARAIAGIEN